MRLPIAILVSERKMYISQILLGIWSTEVELSEISKRHKKQ